MPRRRRRILTIQNRSTACARRSCQEKRSDAGLGQRSAGEVERFKDAAAAAQRNRTYVADCGVATQAQLGEQRQRDECGAADIADAIALKVEIGQRRAERGENRGAAAIDNIIIERINVKKSVIIN